MLFKTVVSIIAGLVVFALAERAAKGVDLIMEDGLGQLPPLLENLAAPKLNQLSWDADLQQYTGTVHVDLSCSGIIS